VLRWTEKLAVTDFPSFHHPLATGARSSTTSDQTIQDIQQYGFARKLVFREQTAQEGELKTVH